ncbi:hypothetical protein BBP40_004364 [Aspergillus hancockii]|nr:hypothetical protein BBP40_004364 [Aspergillus hancockii]
MRLDQSASTAKPTIVNLEARQVYSGATGRNDQDLADQYGAEAVEEVAAFETAHISAFQSCIEQEGIDCDLELNKAIDVHFDNSRRAKTKEGYESLISQGIHTAKEAEFSPGKIAEAVFGVKGARVCFSCRAGRLWPYKFVTQLLKRAVLDGIKLQAHPSVLRLSESPDADGRWIVVTDRGSIRAKWVVFTSNAYTSAIAPEYKDKIVPVRGVCSRIMVPNLPNSPLNCSYTLRFNAWDYDYRIPRPDGRIVVGGAKSTIFQKTSVWYNTTDDTRLIESAGRYFDN